MKAFAHPFRFTGGRPVTLDTETDAYAAQEILTVLQTRPGELPLLPDFGTSDPVFDEIDRASFYNTVSTYFPGIAIRSIEESITDDGVVEVAVDYARISPPPVTV